MNPHPFRDTILSRARLPLRHSGKFILLYRTLTPLICHAYRARLRRSRLSAFCFACLQKSRQPRPHLRRSRRLDMALVLRGDESTAECFHTSPLTRLPLCHSGKFILLYRTLTPLICHAYRARLRRSRWTPQSTKQCNNTEEKNQTSEIIEKTPQWGVFCGMIWS